jgi:hypothetical protein
MSSRLFDLKVGEQLKLSKSKLSHPLMEGQNGLNDL